MSVEKSVRWQKHRKMVRNTISKNCGEFGNQNRLTPFCSQKKDLEISYVK